MRRGAVVILLVAVLALSGCATGPATEKERDAAWASALSDGLSAAHPDNGSEPPLVTVSGARVRVMVYAGSDATWAQVEEELRRVASAVAEPPYSELEVAITLVGAGYFKWKRYEPSDLAPTLAATTIWFENRWAVEEGWVGGDVVMLKLNSDDPAERARVLEQLADAGLNASASSVAIRG